MSDSQPRLPLEYIRNRRETAYNRFSDAEAVNERKQVGKRFYEAFRTTLDAPVTNLSVAELLGESEFTVANVRKGEIFPSVQMMLKFKRLTGRSVDWLLTGE